MKFSLSKLLVVALASTEVAVASTWFGKTGKLNLILASLDFSAEADSNAVYNKWHETELERWLSDHDIPYPTPADRKDLENLVKENWQAKVVEPVVATGDKANDHYGSVKDWIFDRLAAHILLTTLSPFTDLETAGLNLLSSLSSIITVFPPLSHEPETVFWPQLVTTTKRLPRKLANTITTRVTGYTHLGLNPI